MRFAIILTLAVTLPTGIDAYEMEDVKRIDFEFRDTESQELYFSGYENITQEGPATRKETWIYDLKKVEVQYENVLYNSSSLRVESYRFKSSVTGEETELLTQDHRMNIKYRPDFSKPYKDGAMSWEKDAYHGKVFNNLILRNWASLLNDKPLKFELVLPFLFKSINFQIVYRNVRAVRGEEHEIFALQPTSLIIRTIAPVMELHYTKGEKPRIRQFTGPSAIPIQGKTGRMIDIIFSYPKD